MKVNKKLKVVTIRLFKWLKIKLRKRIKYQIIRINRSKHNKINSKPKEKEVNSQKCKIKKKRTINRSIFQGVSTRK